MLLIFKGPLLVEPRI